MRHLIMTVASMGLLVGAAHAAGNHAGVDDEMAIGKPGDAAKAKRTKGKKTPDPEGIEAAK